MGNRNMGNLLHETITILQAYRKEPKDVEFVFGRSCKKVHGWCTWDEFALKADKEYDSGNGATYVCEYLKIVGDNWWLERHVYDGSERWLFQQKPIRGNRLGVVVWDAEYYEDGGFYEWD